jgi:hypothetical protein
VPPWVVDEVPASEVLTQLKLWRIEAEASD